MSPVRRYCEGRTGDGRRCGAAPARHRPYCLFHDPDRAEEAAEARSLGGKRRRRETLLRAAFDLDDLRSADGIARLLDVVVTDALALDAGPARTRVLLQAAGVLLRVVEASDLEARIRSLEGQRGVPRPGEPRVGSMLPARRRP